MNILERTTVVFKLPNVTLIGQIVPGSEADEVEDGFIKLYDPGEVHMIPAKEGGMNFGMIPFLPYREGEYVLIAQAAIEAKATVGERMLNAYRHVILGEKIAVPEKKLILG